jgi:hypothetical protein
LFEGGFGEVWVKALHAHKSPQTTPNPVLSQQPVESVANPLCSVNNEFICFTPRGVRGLRGRVAGGLHRVHCAPPPCSSRVSEGGKSHDSMEYRRRDGDPLFPLPCQRPEGALAGRSRSSHHRAAAAWGELAGCQSKTQGCWEVFLWYRPGLCQCRFGTGLYRAF